MRCHVIVAVSALLVLALWAPAEEKAGAQTADTPAPANEWHGTVGCAKCDFESQSGVEECLPGLKTADGFFLMKPAPTSPPAIKEFLTRIQEKAMQGTYLVKGEQTEVDGKKWIVVSTMVAKPLPVTTGTLTLNRNKNSTTGGGKAADQGGGRGGDLLGGGGGGRGGHGKRHSHGGGDGGDGGGDAGGGEGQ